MTSAVHQAAWILCLAQTTHSEQKVGRFLELALGLPRAIRLADATGAQSTHLLFQPCDVILSRTGLLGKSRYIRPARRVGPPRLPGGPQRACSRRVASPRPETHSQVPPEAATRRGVTRRPELCLWPQRPGTAVDPPSWPLPAAPSLCVPKLRRTRREKSVLPEGVTRPGPQCREPCEGHPGTLSAAQRAFLSSWRPGTAGHAETQSVRAGGPSGWGSFEKGDAYLDRGGGWFPLKRKNLFAPDVAVGM